MPRLIFLIILTLCLHHAQAYAQTTPEFSLDLARNHIDITTAFSGTDMVVYGSKPDNTDVAVIMHGPRRAVMMRKKGEVAGIWVNVDSMLYHNVPNYYDYAVSRPESLIAVQSELNAYDIGLNALNFAPAYESEADDLLRFTEALIRNKQKNMVFPLYAEKIEYINDNFFKVVFTLPPQLPTGPYLVEAFLIKDGEIIKRESEKLQVAQTGLNARLHSFARDHSLLYGIFAVGVALLAGWTAYYSRRRS
jgi:uncharacterized protein (TIGR02186 family)